MASPRPTILLLHEGELDDVRELLDRMGVAYVEWRGSATQAYEQSPWGLVIATPQRFADSDFGGVGGAPAGIAVVDKDSQGPYPQRRPSGVDYLVERPVHAGALRLLILRLLYRGPERRAFQRTSVGFPIQLRTPLRWRPAYLLDLSATGCRLLSSRAAGFGRRASVRLPPELTGGSELVLRGRVAHIGPGEQGADAIALRFGPLPTRELRALEALVRELSEGQAAPAGERRGLGRRAYSRRVIALGQESARVVLGRDLSPGGMRIEPTQKLALGESLRLALHLDPGRDPLVVAARVERDDGPEGLLLRFPELPPSAAAYLSGMLARLPRLSAWNEAEPSAPLVVSEILE
jgi:hypothetical protein